MCEKAGHHFKHVCEDVASLSASVLRQAKKFQLSCIVNRVLTTLNWAIVVVAGL